MDSKQSKMNVLMLPWLAQGHITPFLELAKKLTHKNFHIYFCSTPINLKSIKKRITDKYSLSIELVEIHLPTLPELPPHHHTTNGLPLHLNSTLQEAFEMASPNFSNILKTLNPDLVIHDFKPSSAQSIASSYNIPAVQLMTSGAVVVSFGSHMFNHPNVEFPFPAIHLHEFQEKLFRQMVMDVARTAKQKQSTPVNNDQPPCNITLFNTFRELEGKYIDHLSVTRDKRVVPVGPLVQGVVDDEKEHSEIIQWLENKGKYSLSIELVEIHLPSLPELPPHYHTTNGLPIHLNSTLQEAFEMASPNFSNILKTLSPDLLIHDIRPSWAPPIASSYNIPAVHLMTSGAMAVSFSLHMFHPNDEFPFPTVQLHEFHEKLFRQMFETAAKTSKEKQVIPVNNDQPPCNFMLFNTFRDLEGKYIDYLSAIGEKRAVPVGPLVQGFVDDENENSEIIQWLDNKGCIRVKE
ncbi:Beta-D-glucosyl crocetin beta-1,6-glucosyltransferase [Camellia lanceoleosa]|uniref:Beta-D-glucosyl crocetin beta-1,6-glucosyltransferase n=1 Tax=Camellia lanceoleosa TaxID=1840588 RepID=A0ACC0IWF1_9ERIC|nr:Beta-D-glucosyl crocetin beta-1,6-glucosyltransferase [Camellia lanceoleosa]